MIAIISVVNSYPQLTAIIVKKKLNSLDTAVQFADPDFLLECKISAIWRRFPLIFAFYMLNVRHISTSGLSDLLT